MFSHFLVLIVLSLSLGGHLTKNVVKLSEGSFLVEEVRVLDTKSSSSTVILSGAIFHGLSPAVRALSFKDLDLSQSLLPPSSLNTLYLAQAPPALS